MSSFNPITPSSHLTPDIEQKTFGTIRLHPKDKIYENLEKDEDIILCVERHWSKLVRPAINAVGMTILPLVAIAVYYVLSFSYPTIPQLFIMMWVWYCFVIYYVLYQLIVWRSDIYIITDERIIDFDARDFFSEKATDTDLDSIHEIRYEVASSLFSMGMDKGDVILKDVSGGELRLQNIPHPTDISLVLGEIIEKNKDALRASSQSVVETPTI